MSDGVANANLVVFKQDAMGFGADHVGPCESHDVALGHHGSSDVWIEFAIVVNDGVQKFTVSGFKGFLVLTKDGHASWLGWHQIIAPPAHAETKTGNSNL